MSIASPREKSQIFFHVQDMTSLHSGDAVMEAWGGLADRATVRIDLPMRRVEIDPTSAEPAEFHAAIANAGYSSVRQWPPESSYF